MGKFLKENCFKLGILVMALLVGTLIVLYIRSNEKEIYTKCNRQAIEQAQSANAHLPTNMTGEEYNNFYNQQYVKCLRENGLDK